MLKDFNTYLETIDSDFWSRLIREHGVLKKLEKGEEFIREGEVAKYIGLIKSGSVKYIAYTSDFDEKVVGLETVDGFAASWPYCLHGIPSVVTILANSPLEIYCLSAKRIKQLTALIPDLEEKIAHSTEQVFYTAYQRLISFYTQTPKERYEELLIKCPKVFEIFDLKDIASFLNITPQHLSRLRKSKC